MFQIFANLKDEVALILLGSNETENSLNYKNIKVTHSLALPCWEMVQFVEDLTGTMVNADWLDAIVVAMNILKEETEYVECLSCLFVVVIIIIVTISSSSKAVVITEMLNGLLWP
jgi:hypothetical protein